MDERARGTWPGVLDAGVLKPQVVQASHRLADAAKVGDWYGTLAALESSHWLDANCWRITGRSWFTPCTRSPGTALPSRSRNGFWNEARGGGCGPLTVVAPSTSPGSADTHTWSGPWTHLG